MNRSRSTASSCTARHAFPPVVRDRPARDGLKSAHRRVLEASRGADAGERRPKRGAKRRRWGGRGRTCSPAAAEPARRRSSASGTFLVLDTARPPFHESPPVSREVGRRGSLMRTRRGGSGRWARASGGAGEAVAPSGRNRARPGCQATSEKCEGDEERRPAGDVVNINAVPHLSAWSGSEQ